MSNQLRPTPVVREEFPERQLPDPPVNPQLLWPSIKYEKGIKNQDSLFFPNKENVRKRYNASDTVLKLVAFEEAVMKAEVCILVLDLHFDASGYQAIENAIPSSEANDIRLLTGSSIEKGKRDQLRIELTQYCNLYRDIPQREVLWKASLDKHLFPFPHDRFAIVDGALWHFGSTVGGGHSGLTAASGPWSARKTRAKEFFEECWRIYNA